jgi:DNA-binding FadR family transcriptional regulator
MELDNRFHELIARASGNPLYATLIASFRRHTPDLAHRLALPGSTREPD